MKGKKEIDVYLQAITMIDLATDSIKICYIREARADLVAHQVYLTWRTRYSLPNIIKVNRGKEIILC